VGGQTGFKDGTRVGRNVTPLVGFTVKDIVAGEKDTVAGAAPGVGVDVGTALGVAVGVDVGTAVGVAVGFDVGTAVGNTVGDDVGTAVGVGVTHAVCAALAVLPAGHT
jgi:hypothetical protein